MKFTYRTDESRVGRDLMRNIVYTTRIIMICVHIYKDR